MGDADAEGRGGSGDGGPDGAAGRRRHPADESLRTDELPDAVRCPHCGGSDTEQGGAFGSAVSVSQYWCRRCRTVFEFFKWRRAGDDD
jgi:hypothetical protein